MSADKPDRPEFLNSVEQRFGLCPSFFTTPASKDTAAALFEMAKFAYLDAPFPSLFKEKLFVYLSRFCRSSYCFARHAAFLHGLGNTAGDPECAGMPTEEILKVLKLPIPSPETLATIIERFETHKLGANEWEPEQEPVLILMASISFRRQAGCDRVEQALASYFGAVRYDRLIAFLSFVHSAHYWTETHCTLTPEVDINEWLNAEPELAAWINTNFPWSQRTSDATPERVEDQQSEPLTCPTPPTPKNETERLTALHDSGLLDSEPEPEFDDIARMAASICQTPISVISLIDKDRQWFKAKVGIEAEETSRGISFCAHAICRPGEIMVVPDASQDIRFHDNPLVTGDPGIRFYAGVPLEDQFGHQLGTLCVIDRKAREISPDQKLALGALTRQFSLQLALREGNKRLAEEIKKRKELERQQKQRADSFQDLVEHAVDLVQSVDASGNFLYVNAAWRDTMGYTNKEALQLNIFDVLAPECLDACRETFERVMQGQEINAIESAFVTRSGKQVALIGNISCRVENGRPIATRGIFRPAIPDLTRVLSSQNADSLTCMCSWCKNVRTHNGQWERLEDYLANHPKILFTHGMCDNCATQMMDDMAPNEE